MMNAPFVIHAFLAQLQGAAPSGAVPLPVPAAPVPLGPGASPGDELRDILPPLEVPFWNLERRLLAAAAAVVLTLILWNLYRRWQRRPQPPVTPPDPLKVALAALLRLDSPEGTALSDRDFAAAVAEVLRRFLEARHALAAPRQTTEEFLETAERSNRFPQVVQEQLHHFLRRCDELKFAKAGTNGSGRKDLRDLAEQMLREALS